MSIPALVLSFDFEIGWGDVTNGIWATRERRGTYDALRDVLPKMLETMRELEIPATWATVGAMVAPPERRDFSYLPDRARAIVERSLADGKSTSFDGIDLFEQVLAHSGTGHRVACHGFSHVPFDFEGMQASVVREDLSRAADAFGAFGIVPDRFVFPENTEGAHEELMAAGLVKARVAAVRTATTRLGYLIGTVSRPPPSAVTSIHPSGMELESGSMLFNMGVGKAYRMPFVAHRAASGLRALGRGQIPRLHVWAHPFNFAESDLLLGSFTRFLRQAARERDAGKVQVELM